MMNLKVVKSMKLADQVAIEFAYMENLRFRVYGKVVDGKLKVERGDPWDSFDGRSLQGYIIPNEVYSAAYRQAYAKIRETGIFEDQLNKQLELGLKV